MRGEIFPKIDFFPLLHPTIRHKAQESSNLLTNKTMEYRKTAKFGFFVSFCLQFFPCFFFLNKCEVVNL